MEYFGSDTYLKVHVDRSAGTPRKSHAATIKRNIERQIERGEYCAPPTLVERPTFIDAAVAYMKAGRSRDHLDKLIEHFGETPIEEIDQAAISLNPNVTPATRNRKVYSPVSAILHHAGRDIKLRRPKGAKGRIISDYLTHPDAEAIILAARAIDAELALLLSFLLFTGTRLGEALALQWHDVELDHASARVRASKNGLPRELYLRADLRAELEAHRALDRGGRVFRHCQGGHLKHLLLRAKLASLGLSCPVRRPTGWRPPPYRLAWVNFHSFRHTWASWMRRFGGADLQGLVATGNWTDTGSASRYAHAVAREEWQRVERLPAISKDRAPERESKIRAKPVQSRTQRR